MPRPVERHQRRRRGGAWAGSWARAARVATILCDTGFRYLSTLYSAEWLEAKGLPVFDWLR